MYVGGVNDISGEPKTPDSKPGKCTQDYIVPPKQKWLDGIARADGKVSQFVAAVAGSGYSIEAQVTGQDCICGMQFEIIPRKPSARQEGAIGTQLRIKTLRGEVLSVIISMSDTVEELKMAILDEIDVPKDQQRLV